PRLRRQLGLVLPLPVPARPRREARGGGVHVRPARAQARRGVAGRGQGPGQRAQDDRGGAPPRRGTARAGRPPAVAQDRGGQRRTWQRARAGEKGGNHGGTLTLLFVVVVYQPCLDVRKGGTGTELGWDRFHRKGSESEGRVPCRKNIK